MKQPRTVKKNHTLTTEKTPFVEDHSRAKGENACKKPDDVQDPNLTAIIENLNGYVWNIGKDRKYIVFNTLLKDKVREIFGVDIQKGDNAISVLESFAPSKKKEWEELYELGFQGQPHRDIHEFNLYSSPFYLDISLNAIKENDEITGVSCFARDVTDQVLKQKQLSEAEGRFQRLVENTHDGISLLSAEGKLIYGTPSVKRILGYETEEMVGSDPITITHPEDREQLVAVLQNPGIRPGETVIGTYRILHKNGSWRWLSANITNLLHEPGIQAIVFNYKDVTERMMAIENLSKSEANLRSIFENTGTGLLLLDKTYKIVAFNHQAAEWIECESGQQLKEKSSYFDYVPSESREGRSQKLALVLQGTKLQYQLQGKKIEGKAKWYTISMRRIVEDNGEPIGICISICDITERKEVDATIRDSEILYRSLFNNSPLPKWVCDQKNLRYLEVNDTAVAHYGYSREEFLTLTAFDLRNKKDHAELNSFILSKGDRAYKSGKMQHIKKNGEKIFVEVVAHPIIYKGIKAYLVIAHDISKTLQLQKELMQEKVNKQIEITRATIAAQEKERDEVGKELHDNVNQMLASVKLYLETYDADKAKYSGLLQKSRQTITDSISEIRRISKSLAPPSLGNVTLKESLEELVLNLTLAGKTVKLLFDTLREDQLSRELKISVYRIAQEQMNNIMKYSNASIVIISLEHDNNVLNLQIDDDGIGFDTAKKRKGIGITNIINRAATFNGKVHIDSSPGNGCRLNVLFCL